MNPIIINENIQLQPTNEKQAAQLFAAIDNNRTHLAKFLPWVGNMQTVDHLTTYLKNAATLNEQKQEASFAILFNDVAVGRIGLHYINHQNKTGSIGYWLTEAAQGKGIILRSCKALINYGFQNLGLHRIEIKAAVDNVKSQTIPVKLNFKKEGILRQAEFVNHQYHDLILYAMLSDEWQK